MSAAESKDSLEQDEKRKRVTVEETTEGERPVGISEELWERFQATRARVAAQRARRPPPHKSVLNSQPAPALSPSPGLVPKIELTVRGKRQRPVWTMEPKARWERKGAM